MSLDPADEDRRARMAEAVRLIVTRREQAPRSPRLERALKRLIWRYTLAIKNKEERNEQE